MKMSPDDCYALRQAYEPLTHNATGRGIELASIAISLKRLADALERHAMVSDPVAVEPTVSFETSKAQVERECTCHPDDRKGRPCQRRFALFECFPDRCV